MCNTVDAPDFNVEAGDVFGACIFDPDGSPRNIDLNVLILNTAPRH